MDLLIIFLQSVTFLVVDDFAKKSDLVLGTSHCDCLRAQRFQTLITSLFENISQIKNNDFLKVEEAIF